MRSNGMHCSVTYLFHWTAFHVIKWTYLMSLWAASADEAQGGWVQTLMVPSWAEPGSLFLLLLCEQWFSERLCRQTFIQPTTVPLHAILIFLRKKDSKATWIKCLSCKWVSLVGRRGVTHHHVCHFWFCSTTKFISNATLFLVNTRKI